jgi:DMSO/TMAO reductase YedYZ molybdopterin-dependent catalytic subunit
MSRILMKFFCLLIILLTPPAMWANPEKVGKTVSEAPKVKQVDSRPCDPLPITVPKVPETVPGYTELDSATGLHVTGTIPEIKFERFRLEVVGEVNNPLKLSYDDLRCMPKIEARPELVCPGFFKDKATWAGTPIAYVLELAGLKDGAGEINLVSADGYESSLSLKEVLASSGFLAYEWEGQPIPQLHGFPVRAVFPKLPGSYWVKWLIRIEVRVKKGRFDAPG